MECYKIENLNFSYPDNTRFALSNINLTVKSGEFICLCGQSGCGKTTLLRMLKPALSPVGTKSGNIYFCGTDVSALASDVQAKKIGFVMQNVDNQLVTDKVWHELAFGLESLGVKNEEIRTRVSEIAEFFGITDNFHKNVSELSGGEKQILNLASVMVMQPDVLILDEPTSQLDPIAASEFMNTLVKINRELGTTVILSEHRLEDAFAAADRVIVMDNGAVIANATPNNVGKLLFEQNHPMFAALPVPVRVSATLGGDTLPVTVRDGRIWLDNYIKTNKINPTLEIPDRQQSTDTVIDMKNVHFRYEQTDDDIIKGLSLKVNRGEFRAIIGGNGVGKSTTLSLICGLNRSQRGKVSVSGKCVMLPQDPRILFTQKTVREDLYEMTNNESLISQVVSLCGIDGLQDSHPYDLSGGEVQRAALAKVLLTQPDVLLLDEPTKGLDEHFKIKLADILKSLTQNGTAIVMVSHDIEFCAKYADLCSMLFDGAVTATQTPTEMFSSNTFYTTSANRMAKKIIDNAVTAEDIISACGGTAKIRPEPQNITPPIGAVSTPTPKKEPTKRHAFSLIPVISVLVAVPLTIFCGKYLFDDRKYYFISLLIIFEILIPFLIAFDKRKPKARELVTISVLCALAVCGRMVFYMLPQFKPTLAIVIISGVSLGGEIGFLVGAVSAFVSNFFFGQGPWTPWQMFAFGAVGFLSGILFFNRTVKHKKTVFCIFGFLATVIIYGGIMNPASVLMSNAAPSLGAILSSYALGLPFDLIHSVSTVLFMWFAVKPMTDKLERIKKIYGI